MTPHISASIGDVAETVLMPGDPRRAEWVAKTFLDSARLINDVRGMFGFTGTWQGKPVTIHGSGMGMPSMSIYANELITTYGAKKLIRIGSCGAIQPHIPLGAVLAAMTSSSISTPSSSLFRELNFAPCADYELLANAVLAAREKQIPLHAGGIYSSDTFYDERDDLNDVLVRHGVLAVEMEAAELYTVAARHDARALALLTVSDQLVHKQHMTPEERETGFAAMVEIALNAALN